MSTDSTERRHHSSGFSSDADDSMSMPLQPLMAQKRRGLSSNHLGGTARQLAGSWLPLGPIEDLHLPMFSQQDCELAGNEL